MVLNRVLCAETLIQFLVNSFGNISENIRKYSLHSIIFIMLFNSIDVTRHSVEQCFGKLPDCPGPMQISSIYRHLGSGKCPLMVEETSKHIKLNKGMMVTFCFIEFYLEFMVYLELLV